MNSTNLTGHILESGEYVRRIKDNQLMRVVRSTRKQAICRWFVDGIEHVDAIPLSKLKFYQH